MAAGLVGCIERRLLIDSDPPGADVRLNGLAVGKTPLEIPFRQYGVYEVELVKEGFERIRAEERVLPPLYARFPLCLFTELLLPVRIRDWRFLRYRLEPPRMPDRDELIERAARRSVGPSK